MTQAEVLNLLRKVPFNEVVELVISRQETDLSPSPSLPRQLVRDILLFDITKIMRADYLLNC